LKIVIDMNLSPRWVEVLHAQGFDAIHWSSVGAATASDSTILAWAKTNDAIVFTNDLDFTAILAATNANSPSVIQLRGERIHHLQVSEIVVAALSQYATELEAGALLVIEDPKLRLRILPFR
jgi:predicted nuclease of predicted toxin-antitoxin system